LILLSFVLNIPKVFDYRELSGLRLIILLSIQYDKNSKVNDCSYNNDNVNKTSIYLIISSFFCIK